MPTNPTTGNGQEPTASQSPDGNGQVPPTSQDATQTAQGDTPGDSTTLSVEQLREINEKLRKENAARRVDAKRLAELEAAENERAEAALSDKERYEKKIAALQAQVAEEQQASQARMVRAEVRSVAQSLGIKAELALRLIDTAAISYNDDGDPTNVSELLKAAMEEYGLNVAQAQQQQPQQQPSGIPQTGATNPPRGSQRVGANGVFAQNEIVRSVNDPRLWKRGS